MVDDITSAVGRLRDKWLGLSSDPDITLIFRDEYAERAEDLTALLAQFPRETAPTPPAE